ncbi:hypothetical protein [Atopomonas sediminilitoris]|uniref:hypothetical protein n=1 Tax=Atopomonas sediminilitoris TaxID=2919919 RepID=UPI001F4EDB32|nr:hypothetical protein [Atopomonas sediminilitoris]MCJ8168661.1 hypothetical protein [Atopomonas sediminilitoris]
MNKPALSTQALLATRRHHMDSLKRLRRASQHWNADTAPRGEDTMANLMQQVYDIDTQLAQLGCVAEAA